MPVSNKRIAKNTMFLYLRQILIMAVSLYTVRIVLNVLGAEDYGIYNVVAGAVTMFGFLTGAMASSNQRFLSYYIGKGDEYKLRDIFNAIIVVYILLILIIIVLAEAIGLWFMEYKLVIPQNRLVAAHWVFQCSVLSFIQSVLVTPYKAALIAHENMRVYAQISIVEALLMLLISYALVVIPLDKMVVYGVLSLCVTTINTTLYRRYCVRHYQECRFRLRWDSVTIKEIVGFSCWNLFGNFTWVVKNQGIAFLLNMFLGPVVNAAHQIAMQVRTASATFAQNFSTAVQPSIVKTYASGEYDTMFAVAFRASRFNFYLLLIVLLPIVFNLDYILALWLKEVPEYTVIFCKLLLVETLIEMTSTPFATITQATGRIQLYQALIGLFGVLNLPFAYIVLRNGATPETVFLISIGLQCCIVMVRIVFLQRVRAHIVGACLKHVILPCVALALVAYALCRFMFSPSDNFWGTLGLVVSQVCVTAAVIFAFGLRRDEKEYVLSLIRKLLKIKG